MLKFKINQVNQTEYKVHLTQEEVQDILRRYIVKMIANQNKAFTVNSGDEFKCFFRKDDKGTRGFILETETTYTNCHLPMIEATPPPAPAAPAIDNYEEVKHCDD